MTRRAALRLAALAVGGSLLAACQPQASSVAKATQSTKPAAGAEPSWDSVVAAAKKEGKVVVWGGPGDGSRIALSEGFQTKYPEIEVEYSGLPGAQVVAKLQGELSANQHLTDVLINGTSTILGTLTAAGAVAPLQPFLVGPEARDQSKWLGGKLSFADEGAKYNLVFSAYVKGPFLYNPSLVSPSEFTSVRDLLNPKWKGKIMMYDPSLAGGGQGYATWWYATPELGKDFIKQLFTQEIVISRDSRQILDSVAHGAYSISIGAGDLETIAAIRNGLPLKYMEPGKVKEGPYMTAGGGSLGVVNDPPHPNAVRVYLDWLLSRDGQLAWSKDAGFASLRKDVPTDHVLPEMVPKEGVKYFEQHMERYVNLRPEILEYLKTVMPA